ncbi:MAG TPA: glycosyltransferase 87 family protein [Candidatus Limnocylindrales bacterium]|nr:glycosyltransferase 87 family protein [Candidatus Limnocylindrales bacterium]
MSTPARSRRRRNVNLVLFAAATFGVLVGVNTFLLHLGSDPFADIHAYYDAGARLNAGQPLYEQAATTNQAEFYRYPPLLAIAFRPLALLPFETAAIIWEAIVVASLVLLIVWLRPGFRGRLMIGMLAMPILWSLAIGQAQIPMTLLMAYGTPWSLAFATHFKVLPALAAIWWIGRRDWRSLAQFAVWVVVLGAVQLVFEPAATLAFPSVFTLAQVGEVRNFSPYVISPILWAVLVVGGAILALRFAPTRWGWAAAVALAVLATPRLILYQLMTLLAGLREPGSARVANPEPAEAAAPATRTVTG